MVVTLLSKVSAAQLIWVFSSGFASFSVSFEVCAYAVVDICSKVPCQNLSNTSDSLGLLTIALGLEFTR